MAECSRKIRVYLELSERTDRWMQRLVFETDTINRASQHDLVLFGKVTATSTLTFTWRARNRVRRSWFR